MSRAGEGTAMFEIAYKTCSGILDRNEDCIFVNGEIYASGSGHMEREACLLAVCDGVGGERFGEEASHAACSALRGYLGLKFTDALANQYVRDANGLIREAQKKDAAHGGMSTTAAVLSLRGKDVFAFNLGDSEIMRLRGGTLYRLSQKHTVVNEFQSFGFQALDTDRHVITKYLGGRGFAPAVFDGGDTLDQDDIFILFSDGVGDVMTKPELKAVLLSEMPLERMCDDICGRAMEKGSDDNISVIIARGARE